MLLVAAAIYLAGDYQPPVGNDVATTVCGPGTEPVNAGGTTVCISAPTVESPQSTVIVQQPNVLVPTEYGFSGGFGGFGFRHFRR
jgi:hypothetical protein